MDTLSTGHQEQVGNGSTPQSDRDHVIVSDIVVSKIAGLAAQEIEGVQVSSGHAQTLGSFLDRVSTNGHPRSVSAMVFVVPIHLVAKKNNPLNIPVNSGPTPSSYGA